MTDARPSSERLHLLVHDYDEEQCQYRCDMLRALFPAARVEGYTLRRDLLDRIAGLPTHRPDERWPLALIDLQGTGDRLARGEHLLATINEHPSLRSRVALVAFTRYGFSSRDDVLVAKGARAVVHPDLVRRGSPLVPRGFAIISKGYEGRAILRVGEPPSTAANQRVLALMKAFFAELDGPLLTPEEQWQRTLEILHACRLERDRYPWRTILAQMGWERRELEALRNQLIASEAAYDPEIFPIGQGTPELAGVIDALQPFLDESEAIWKITTERGVLDGGARLRRLVGVTRDLRGDVEGGAWIPPSFQRTLRVFLWEYEECRHAVRGNNPSNDRIAELVRRATERAAEELGLDPDEAEYHVIHAALCLEDALAEEARLSRLARAEGDDAPA